ncbi:MAG: TonB-dependent receptor [Salinivirgaceae bacterium]|jgi:outer membrane receptor for ferrienterochelin and colicins|nr:TonB-dependent receptor [Salinivirgaceae bacterium]
MRITILFVWIIALITPVQASKIEGRVIDGTTTEKEPLPGVNVYWAGTTEGTVTDESGYFSISQNIKSNILVISSVGYNTDSIQVSKKGFVEVALRPGKMLDEVTIAERTRATTISRLDTRLSQQITTKELNRFACCNLSESFETNASVDVSYSDAVSGVKQIKMLGLDGRYSQLMLENIPILRGAESAFGLDYIPGTWMESIQVSKGTSAVKNGYESVTGQINIQYKEPSGTEKLHFYTYANQDGKVEANAGYTFKVSEKWKGSLLAHTATNFRELDINKDQFLDKPMASIGTFMNRWEYKGQKVESKIGLSYLAEERQGGQIDFDHNKSPDEQSAYGIGVDVEKIHAFSKIGFLLSRPSTSLGTIFSASSFERNAFYGDRTYNTNQYNLYANFIFQSYFINTSHTYNTGGSIVYDNENFELNDSKSSQEEAVPGVFFEYNYKPIEQLTFMAGMRYDYSTRYGGFETPRVHFRYAFPAYTTIRASAGKGYRTPNALNENTNVLASGRTIIYDDAEIEQEEAWNYGLSLVNDIPVFDRDLTISLEYFYTQFNNQLVVDLEQSRSEVHFYNLDGNAFAHSVQAELIYEIIERLDLTVAYRLNDVRSTYSGNLEKVPYVSRYKGLISAGYRTNMDKWIFDVTAQFHGQTRLPGAYENNAEQFGIDAPESYINMIAQITKNYKRWSFYVGAENLTDYTQKNAIVDVQNPNSNTFDASMVWGPLYGRMFYGGIKYILFD